MFIVYAEHQLVACSLTCFNRWSICQKTGQNGSCDAPDWYSMLRYHSNGMFQPSHSLAFAHDAAGCTNQMIAKRIRMQGFIVGDFAAELGAEFSTAMTQYVLEGKVQGVEHVTMVRAQLVTAQLVTPVGSCTYLSTCQATSSTAGRSLPCCLEEQLWSSEVLHVVCLHCVHSQHAHGMLS